MVVHRSPDVSTEYLEGTLRESSAGGRGRELVRERGCEPFAAGVGVPTFGFLKSTTVVSWMSLLAPSNGDCLVGPCRRGGNRRNLPA